MEIKCYEGVSDPTRDCLCCKPLSLICTCKAIANFGLLLVVFIDYEVTISNKLLRLFEFNGNLHPLPWHACSNLLLLLNKSPGLRFAYPLPTLVSGDYSIIAVSTKCCEIIITKLSQA